MLPTVWEMLTGPKAFKAARRPRIKEKPGNKVLDLELSCPLPGEWRVYVRQLEDLAENFSIGLVVTLDGHVPQVLMRVNGDHGRHRDELGEFDEGPHTHHWPIAELDLPLLHRRRGPPHAARLEDRFRDIPNAWRLFCQLATIQRVSHVDEAVFELHVSQVGLPFIAE